MWFPIVMLEGRGDHGGVGVVGVKKSIEEISSVAANKYLLSGLKRDVCDGKLFSLPRE